MNFPRKSTVTFLFKLSAFSACVLIQSACSSTLSSNSGACASDNDCLGAQSCVDGRCAMACFTMQDCASNETCVFNRCQAGPEVYADVGMPTNDSALVPDLDAAVDGTDSAIVDMTTADDALVSASDATVNQADSALVDMMVSQDASSLDMSPQGDASLVSDGEVNLDEQDASSQDATL